MKRVWKLCILLALTVSLVFSAAACGDKEKEQGTTEMPTMGAMLQTGFDELLKSEQFTLTLRATGTLDGQQDETTAVLAYKGGDFTLSRTMSDDQGQPVTEQVLTVDGVTYEFDRERSFWTASKAPAFDLSALDPSLLPALDDLLASEVTETENGLKATAQINVKEKFDAFVNGLETYSTVTVADALLELRYGVGHTHSVNDLVTELEAMFGENVSVKTFLEEYVDVWLTAIAGEELTVKALADAVCAQAGITATDMYEMISSQGTPGLAAPGSTDTPYTYLINTIGNLQASMLFDSFAGAGAFAEIKETVVMFLTEEIEPGKKITVTQLYDLTVPPFVANMFGIPAESLTYEALSQLDMTAGSIGLTVETDANKALRTIEATFKLAITDVVDADIKLSLTVDTTAAVTIAAPTEKVLVCFEDIVVELATADHGFAIDLLAGSADLDYDFIISYGLYQEGGMRTSYRTDIPAADFATVAEGKLIFPAESTTSCKEFFTRELSALAEGTTGYFVLQALRDLDRTGDYSVALSIDLTTKSGNTTISVGTVTLTWGTLSDYITAAEALIPAQAA